MTVTVSDAERVEALELGIVSADRIMVIPNGVSDQEFDMTPGVERDTPFVSVGRLDEQKGYTYLLEAAAVLMKSEPGFRLRIVGDGPLRQSLEEQAASLGLGETVRFEGQSTEVRRHLQRAHVFVLSSLWEGLPYTIIEAMASGLPVITTDVGGCRELVIHEETGLVVPPADPIALAEAMRVLWSDAGMRKRMGAAGRSFASRAFRLEQTVAGNRGLYDRLLADERDVDREVTMRSLFGRRGALVFLAIILLVAGSAIADGVRNRDRVYTGVTVGSVDVGGLTTDAAADRINGLFEEPVVVEVSDEMTIPVDGGQLEFDVADAIQRAYLVGRIGGLPRRLIERLEAAREGATLSLVAQETTLVAALVEGARSELERPPMDAGFEIAEGGLRVVPDVAAVVVDESGLREQLGAAATREGPTARRFVVSVDRAPAAVTVDELNAHFTEAEKWTAVDVAGVAGTERVSMPRADVAGALTVRKGDLVVSEKWLGEWLGGRIALPVPRDARFVVEGGRVRIIDGVAGARFDTTATARSLEAVLREGSGTFAVVLAEREPVITTQDLESLGITRELSSFTTRFRAGQDGRDVNIQLASEAFRGQVIGIGRTFSLNESTGPRNKGTGYQESLIFMNGKVVPGVGGGVCQVSSTAYQAALRAGLDIVERSSHSMAVSYVPPGLDATAYYPTIDLKFRNSTDGPILLWSSVVDDELAVSVYGSSEKPDVRISTDVKRVIPQREAVRYVRGLRRGERVVESEGMPGYVVASYREIWKQGKLVSRQLLGTDEYRPRDTIISTGI
jgi:vancomycin resistance protein YoaR